MASTTKKEVFISALVAGFLLLLSCPVLAQDEEREKLRELEAQREFQKTRAINARLDSAIQLMNLEQYEAADVKYRSVLASMKSIPSDIAYYFGKNSYHLQKYKQSIDWLTKYIQLKGTTGQFSEDAAAWLKKAEAGLLEQRQALSAKTVEVLSRDFTIDCGPSGKVQCPVCNGSTVVIRKDYLGDKYSTCGYCHKTGFLSCDEYNKLLRGQLKDENTKN
jgi:tetratricopeptide (TPR) repeat protein